MLFGLHYMQTRETKEHFMKIFSYYYRRRVFRRYILLLFYLLDRSCTGVLVRAVVKILVESISSSRTEVLTAGPGSAPTTSSTDTDSKISRSPSAWLCVSSGFICVNMILLISGKLCLLTYMYSLYLN